MVKLEKLGMLGVEVFIEEVNDETNFERKEFLFEVKE